MIISSIELFRQHVSVNRDLSLDSIEQREPTAITKYFSPYFTSALITQLEGYSSETGEKLEAYKMMLNSLCNFTFYECIPFLEVQIGDGGITRTDNENVKTAYSGQVVALKHAALETAYVSLNRLVEIMDATPGDYSEWTNSPLNVINQTLLVSKSGDFNTIIGLHQPFTTFMHLRPLITNVQDLVLSRQFEAALLDELIANVSLSTLKQKLRGYLQHALCNHVVSEGLRKGMVKISAQGVRVHEEDDGTGSVNKALTAPISNVSANFKHYTEQSSQYIQLGIDLITANPLEFGVTPTSSTNPTGRWTG